VRGAVAGLLWVLALAAPALAQQAPVPAAAITIDGPSSAIPIPSGLGLSVARDGTGGLVYLKQVGGTTHVFASVLAGGAFHPPVEIDDTLPGSSSQPVIAAGNGGLLVVAFINGGQLFVAQRLPGATGLSTPTALAGGALNPAISISNYGKAYVAFAAVDGDGYDVRAAYYWQGSWSLESAPLNVTPGDEAGTGAGRPAVATSGDGIAIVAWGEAGGIYTRRVWATNPSVAAERADGPLAGCSEISADQPALGTGGDSSYAVVAFREQLFCGVQRVSRVLMDRLRGSAYDGIAEADGGAGASDGADAPGVAVGEYGDGLVTSQRTASRVIEATPLASNETPGPTSQIDGTPNTSPPINVPAFAGLHSMFVAWQQDPGGSGLPEIRLRYSPGGEGLGPEMVLSAPAQGPANASAGLAADGDAGGEVATAWVQGANAAPQIMAAQLYQPPGGLSPLIRNQYVRTSSPRLAWTAPRSGWGPFKFTLIVDGSQVAQTGATSIQVPGPLSDGPHSYQIGAVNPAGQQNQTGVGTVFVDTTPPVAVLRLSPRPPVGKPVQARLGYHDLPPAGSPPGDASGVRSVKLSWGNRTVVTIPLGQRRTAHVFARPGRYLVTLTVTDRAGNVTVTKLRLRVTKPRPKPKPKGPAGNHP
jgi:hypothetical protein